MKTAKEHALQLEADLVSFFDYYIPGGIGDIDGASVSKVIQMAHMVADKADES